MLIIIIIITINRNCNSVAFQKRNSASVLDSISLFEDFLIAFWYLLCFEYFVVVYYTIMIIIMYFIS